MITIAASKEINKGEKEIILTDGILTQSFSFYFEADPIPALTWDEAFCAQFDQRPMVRKHLLQSILKSFSSGTEIDMNITMEGELFEIRDKPGKGPGWSWYHGPGRKKDQRSD